MTLIVLLAGSLSKPPSLIAKPATELYLPDKSTPQLNVRVYSFPGLSSWVLHGAETEAARTLRGVPIKLKWIDCISQVLSASCTSPQLPADLIVRFLAKALPQASTAALGIADSSDSDAAAFVFYDRVVALRTQTRLLPFMLGRVIAHEITHLLLPGQKHSDLGVMRGQWDAEDLRIMSPTRLGLPAKSVQFIQKEALRRMLSARGRVQK